MSCGGCALAAAQANRVELARLLLAAGGDMHAASFMDRTPKEHAQAIGIERNASVISVFAEAEKRQEARMLLQSVSLCLYSIFLWLSFPA